MKVNLKISNLKSLKRAVSCYNDILPRNSLITMIFSKKWMKLYHFDASRVLQCKFGKRCFEEISFYDSSPTLTVHVVCCLLYKELSLFPQESPVYVSISGDNFVISSVSTSSKSGSSKKSSSSSKNEFSVITQLALMSLEDFEYRELDSTIANDTDYCSFSYNNFPKIVPFISRPNFESLFISISSEGVDFLCSNDNSSSNVSILKKDLCSYSVKGLRKNERRNGLYNTKFICCILSTLLKEEEATILINKRQMLIVKSVLNDEFKLVYFLAPKISEEEETNEPVSEIKKIRENKRIFIEQRKAVPVSKDSNKEEPLNKRRMINKEINNNIEQSSMIDDNFNHEAFIEYMENFDPLTYNNEENNNVQMDQIVFDIDEAPAIETLLQLNNNNN